MTGRFRAATVIATLAWLTVLGTSFAMAQYVEEDDTLKDHADRDAAYLKRIQADDTRAITTKDPEEARKQFLALANELVRDRNFNVAENSRYIVRTDDPRLDPKAVLTLLSSFTDRFEREWKANWGRYTAETEQTPIFMFYSFAKYNQLLDGDFSRSFLRPKGHYADYLGAVVMHSDADAAGDLPDTLVHELTHRLASRLLDIGHHNAPPWVSEGLASYYGFMERDRDGKISPTEIGGKGIALYKDGRPQKPREPYSRLQRSRRLLRAAIRKNEPLAERVVGLESPAGFYSGDINLHYSIAWLLIHYMMHGDNGVLREPFLAWLAGENPSAERLYDALGIAPTDLEQKLSEHASSL